MKRLARISVVGALLVAGTLHPADAAAQHPDGAGPTASVVQRTPPWPALTAQPGPDSAPGAKNGSIVRYSAGSAAPVGQVVVGAAGGWVLGALAGGVVGHVIAPRRQGEYSFLSDGAAGGALVGMAVGAGAGAHLANRRRGNALWPVLGSAVATAGLLLIASAVEDDARRAAVLLIPVAQIGTATLVEVLTAR